MNKIDELLDFLATSGRSCTLDEISIFAGIPCDVCEKIVRFLAEYGFVRLNGSGVEINPKMRDLIIATSSKTLLELTPPITTHM